VSQPLKTVPMMSKTPMTASREAAAVISMPWSCAEGTKWVRISPFVEAPQMANEPASSQNGPVRAASNRTRTVRAAAPVAGAGFSTYAPP